MNRVRKTDNTDITTSNMGRDRYTIRVDYAIINSDRIFGTHTYFVYYNESRTHLALSKDAPIPRATSPPGGGTIVAIPQVGGLHHRYERRAT